MKWCYYLKDECDSIGEDSTDEYDYLKVGFVNHVAYDVYRFKNCDLVVTIGDDTTLVSSDILYRLNIPIIGITDGDLDKVVEKGFVNENSIICEVAPGLDDIVGEEIYRNIFNENIMLEIPYYSENKSADEVLEIFKTSIFNEIERVDSGFMIKE